MAATPCQQSDEAVDRAGGLLGMELQPPTGQYLHIKSLAGLYAEMGQELLAQGHLALAGHREGCTA